MIVDTVVAATGQHLHIAVFERGAVHPAAGFAQPLARRAFLALQQVDFPRRGFRVLVHQAATGVRVEIHAPLRQPFGQRLGAVAGRFGQEFRHVEADAAGADDRHAFAHLHLATQHVHVGHHLGVVDAVDARPARGHPGGDDDLLEAFALQFVALHAPVQHHLDAGAFDALLKVAQGLVELFLAGDHLGHVELTADLAGLVEQGHVVAALRRHRGAGQPGGAGTHHRHFLGRGGAQIDQLGFVAGARVHQAGGALELEGMIQAGLVAGDAGVDLVGAAFGGLVDELRVRQQRPGHGHRVRLAAGDDALGGVRIVDPVGGHHRDRHHVFHLAGDFRERRPGHRGDDGGHPRFVPADAAVDQAGAGFFDGAGQIQHLLAGAAVGHQINHREAVHDDEVLAASAAGFLDDLHREAAAVFGAAAVLVAALVGARRGELINQIALGAHDFHAVVAGFLGQLGGAREVLHRGAHFAGAHGLGLERVDRAFDRRGGAGKRVVAVAAGVQHLQRDLAAFAVHRLGNLAVVADIQLAVEGAGQRVEPAVAVGVDAAGHGQGHPAPRPLGEIGGQLRVVPETVFQAGVHGPHDHPVLELGMPQIQGGKQVGITVGRHGVLLCGLGGPRDVVRGGRLAAIWTPSR